MFKVKTLYITFAVLFFTKHLTAQQAHIPISNFGIGEFIDVEQNAITSQGWNSNTFSDPYQANIQNAASYSFLRSTSFEVGVSGLNSKWKNNTSNYNQWRGYLNHISLSFPIFSPYNDLMEKRERKVYWGMGISLAPYTQVDYNYLYEKNDAEAGILALSQTGDGGTYNLIWNNGISYKGLSLGIGARYTFGNINKIKRLSFNDYNAFLTYLTIDERQVHVSGYSFSFSGQYVYDLNPLTDGKKTDYNKLRQITVGANFQPGSQLSTESSGVAYTLSSKTGGIYDTIALPIDDKQKGNFNSVYGAGLQYRHGSKWKASLNYDIHDFSNYNLNDLPGEYQKGALLKFGAEYCPDAVSFNSFLKRARYRIGFKTGTLPVAINGDQSSVIAGGVGIGFPIFVNRQISHINLGFEGGKKTYGFGYTENYIRFSLGFNLNDDYWFLQKKFN